MRILNFLGAWALLALPQICQGCSTDDDCSLNGVCTSKVCKCDPGWWGSDCGRLDLAPATKGMGYNQVDVSLPGYSKYGNSSWGGEIIQDRNDKKLFHLVAAQFGNGCGLSAWRPHSFVMRAESKTGPQGPYTYVQKIIGAFRHNPFTFWSPSDNKYLLYTIGADVNEPSGCGAVPGVTWTNNISASSAADIHGPWTPFKVFVQDTNPAPWPAWSSDDHTSQMYMATGNFDIYAADSWDSAYKRVYSPTWDTSRTSEYWTEDPFLWRDKRGNWHALVHWMIDIVENDGQKYPRVGAHLFSRSITGTWNFKLQEAFNSTVTYTDGTLQTLNRRERPKLYFSDDGQMTPLYLINGVQEKGSSASYTLIQPVGTVWKDYEKGLGF